MIEYGKGTWTWETLYYRIPVHLRIFYLNEMKRAQEEEQEQQTKTKNTKPAQLPKAVKEKLDKAKAAHYSKST